MSFIFGFLISAVVALLAFTQARAFVTRRLRYVDAVQTMFAPIIAGLVATVIALPVVALLPLVSVGTAVSFGVAVGAGVLTGAREVRTSLPRY